MEEILHHLLHMKPYVLEILHINWWTPDFLTESTVSTA